MKKLCIRCDAITEPKRHTRGSFLVELALWCLFIAPGILYSLWRLSTRAWVCRNCGAPDLIPLTSPRARAQKNYTMDQAERAART